MPPIPSGDRINFRCEHGRAPPDRPDVRFGSKADICTAPAHVRFTPIATLIAFFGVSPLGQKRTFRHSLDHLVGTPDERVGDGDAECRDTQSHGLCLRRTDKIFAQRTPNQISKRKMVTTDMPVEITTAGDTVLKYTLYC